MPQCPHCQSQYEYGQRYCSTCGSFLLHPEEGDTFCPECGVRVSPRQEFCHECDAPLKGAQIAREVLGAEQEPAVPPGAPSPAPAASTGTPTWLIGLFVGTGIVVIILLFLLFSRGASPPPAPPPVTKPEAPAPAPPAPTTPADPTREGSSAAPELKDQLQPVLSMLREAQMRKDIIKFMSAYSLTYPQLDTKRATTMKSWENYDFTNLVFTIDKVQLLDSDNVLAGITWYIDTMNRRTQEINSYSQTYQVRFSKEMGNWRIRSLDEVEQYQ